MRFGRNIGALDEVFAHVDAFARRERLADRAGFALRLAAEELFTNLVRHDVGGADHIDMTLTREAGRAVLRLAHRGVEPFDPATIPAVDVGRALRERDAGGLGVHLVRGFVDRLAYTHAGGALTVTAVLNLEERDVRDSPR